MKVFISISRNIYNQDAIKKVVSDFQGRTSDPKVKNWLKSNFRNYLINEFEGVEHVTQVKPSDPDWVKDGVENKDLYEIDLRSREYRELSQNIEHAIPYLETVREPSRVSVKDAINGGNSLIEKQNEAEEGSEDYEGLETLMEFPQGIKIVSLKSKQAIKREGKLMKHCVGQEEQGYISGVSKGTLEIWSLRDKHNNPKATIEYAAKTKKIQQIKGKVNQGVEKEYTKYLVKFLKKMEKEKKIKEFDEHDLINIGIVEVKGRWFDVYRLPKGLEVDGDLYLINKEVTYLPEDLKVSGDLNLDNTPIKSLPEGLEVGGSLDLENTQIESLPESLKVDGDLYLGYTKIISLPKGLKVSGHLDLRRTPIKSLPEGLKVSGDLNLDNTPIKSLPEGLEVDGDLYLRHTKIISLPEDLKVSGHLNLSDTLIESLPKGLKVSGHLNLSNTPIESLPEGLKVGGGLNLSFTKISSLPEGLKVSGLLDLRGAPISRLPEDLKVGRVIG